MLISCYAQKTKNRQNIFIVAFFVNTLFFLFSRTALSFLQSRTTFNEIQIRKYKEFS